MTGGKKDLLDAGDNDDNDVITMTKMGVFWEYPKVELIAVNILARRFQTQYYIDSIFFRFYLQDVCFYLIFVSSLFGVVEVRVRTLWSKHLLSYTLLL